MRIGEGSALSPVVGLRISPGSATLYRCLRAGFRDAECHGSFGVPYESERNEAAATIDWRFTTKDARAKLRRGSVSV